MSPKPKKDAAAFLRALNMPDQAGAAEDDAPASMPAAAPAPVTAVPSAAPRNKQVGKKSKQAELKHFGGYVDDETFEKIALLRIRLKKDNSELIIHMVNEEYARLNAKRAFGDA